MHVLPELRAETGQMFSQGMVPQVGWINQPAIKPEPTFDRSDGSDRLYMLSGEGASEGKGCHFGFLDQFQIFKLANHQLPTPMKSKPISGLCCLLYLTSVITSYCYQ